MDEPSLAGVDTAAGDRRGGCLPGHPAVHVLVPVAGVVTLQFQFRGPIPSAAAVLRDRPDANHRLLIVQSYLVVERVAALRRHGQLTDRLTDGASLAEFRGHLYGEPLTRKDHNPLAP